MDVARHHDPCIKPYMRPDLFRSLPFFLNHFAGRRRQHFPVFYSSQKTCSVLGTDGYEIATIRGLIPTLQPCGFDTVTISEQRHLVSQYISAKSNGDAPPGRLYCFYDGRNNRIVSGSANRYDKKFSSSTRSSASPKTAAGPALFVASF